ncbi:MULTISPECIES: hypothetical protein [unclassified Actinotalea]|uniref:hypothetical protein n=1 Tax=unclassified Actinotalea TaxID=2638618 RepID=UPI001C715990|nr:MULTISPECIES: hypothetical protein [unclassified Actinotalea]
METRESATPDDARAALRQLDDARALLAERIASPWWYRLGAASCTTSMFVGMGLLVGRPEARGTTESVATLLITLGAVVAPVVLLWALKRATGVSVERYAEGLGAWYVVVFGLLALAFALQAFAGVPAALHVAGAVAFVATVVTERRIDERLRRRVRAGAGVRAAA